MRVEQIRSGAWIVRDAYEGTIWYANGWTNWDIERMVAARVARETARNRAKDEAA